MKLRNKKTGEIADLSVGFIRDTYNGEMIQIKPVAISNKEGYLYGSLAELNEEWEDYEEPKEYWTIDWTCIGVSSNKYSGDDVDGFNKSIGNYFKTKEEAEKAVEKLKAWKRLKDKGFRFDCWYGGSKDISFSIPQEIIDKPTAKDLDLLFGGES